MNCQRFERISLGLCALMKIEIVNVVATTTLGERVNLEGLTELPFITYNPDRYFCAYFKDDTMEAKVSILNSGMMIAVGAKSEEAAR
jgi:TATA-box binding protein (TBP) (component of TFIID and TFIIIB)